MLRFLGKPWIWILVVLIAAPSVFFLLRKEAPLEYSSIEVKKGTLVQEVSETGNVVSNVEISYGWETSGRVIGVEKKIGDAVEQNEVIARLENTQQSTRLKQAQAVLASAQAQLNLKLAGASAEDKKKVLAALDQAYAEQKKTTTTSDAAISTAKKALETAKNNLQLVSAGENSKVVEDAYETLFNILKKSIADMIAAQEAVDAVVGIDNTFANADFENSLGTLSAGSKDKAEMAYVSAKEVLKKARAVTDQLTLSSSHTAMDSSAVGVKQALSSVRDSLMSTAVLLNATLPLGGMTQTKLDALKAGVSANQTVISASIVSLTSATQGVTSARSTLTNYEIAYQKAEQDYFSVLKQSESSSAIADAQVMQAKAAYEAVIAPPRFVDLASLQADVTRYEAGVFSAQDDLEKTMLRARTSGVISVLNAKVGEVIAPNAQMVTLISTDQKIEVDISESDIAKVNLNHPVKITFDALRDQTVLTGTVSLIDPAQTLISGVVYYKTTIVLNPSELLQNVKPGMTANVVIETARKENRMLIPSRAVLKENGASYVRVLKNKKWDKRFVTTGLKNAEGEIEIASGLNEGDVVITFLKETK